MTRSTFVFPSLFASVIFAGTVCASPQELVVTPDMLEPPPVYSPYVGRDYPDEILFGDTDFHTNLSFDAGLVGTRIRVRVFAGWDFDPVEVSRPDFVHQGYKRGVPMGGTLTEAPDGGAPGFMIRVLRDPDGANLDRVQVIKGWLDSDGYTHERIYDVAVSDGREIGADRRARQPVGNTVDLDNATFTNTIGDALMSTYWQDPDFDPERHAFYYVRVLEIPTPRWTTYDAAYFGIERPDIVPATVQDRAYTSPIWYEP